MPGTPFSLDTLDLQELWGKYEDIAMHFNDLLMRLRSQSLAGIAAISTLVGIFAREGTNIHMDWLVATAIFIALAMFWVAIGCLDLLYYNRLLVGSVAAIVELEEKMHVDGVIGIKISTSIEHEFKRCILDHGVWRYGGVLLFYAVVLIAVSSGVLFSLYMYWDS